VSGGPLPFVLGCIRLERERSWGARTREEAEDARARAGRDDDDDESEQAKVAGDDSLAVLPRTEGGRYESGCLAGAVRTSETQESREAAREEVLVEGGSRVASVRARGRRRLSRAFVWSVTHSTRDLD
jgi:hypothetical protein